MSGVKGKSGRKHKTLTRERAIQSLTQKLPKAIQVIGDTMEGLISDRLRYESAIEIKNSVMGKPTGADTLEIKGGEQLAAGTVVELFRILYEKQKELQEGRYAIQGQGEGQALAQGENEGAEAGIEAKQ